MVKIFVTIAVFILNLITICSAQTGSGNKWLPGADNVRPIAPEVDDFLKSVEGKMRILYCSYDRSNLSDYRNLAIGKSKIGEEVWRTEVNASTVETNRTALDLDITFHLESGNIKNAGIAVLFDFKDWNTDNYVMLPASVYNGNRIKLVDRGYATGLDRKYLYKKDIPMMSVPIPQLSPEKGTVSRLEVNAGNLSTPAMCFFSKEKGRGFIVLAEQNTPYGDNGFMVEESADRKKVTFVVAAPGVREKKPLFVGFEDSPDRGATLKSGDNLKLKLRIYCFEVKDIPQLLDKFMTVRKEVTGPNNPRNLIPFSQVAQWMTERIDGRWYDGKDYQFYRPENANWISFGWIGGLMNTFPMLALGDSLHLNRVVKTFDFAIPRGQGLSGYFYGALNYDGKPFGREGYDEFPEIVLTRKNADVLFWMLKQFELLKALGRSGAIEPEWEYNIKRLADAFVSTWGKNGQWGRMLNNQTGDVAEYNTSGGVMAIGGLALAAEYYNEPEYLKIAERAANLYYSRDFENQGMTTGGCADILQNADSETAAGFMTSLMILYEVTGDKLWLEKSRNLANLVATWTTSYDYELPKKTELSKLGAALAGVYWASTQNKHSAPGICTSSGYPLFKIFRATGNKLYADLLNDIVRAYGESIRSGGYTNERLTYCDAEPFSVGNRGNHITGWNELNGFLMALEIPGIYLTTDAKQFYVFDSVEAEIIERNDNGIVLKVTNSTKYDAKVSVLAETNAQSRDPLGYTTFINWPKVYIGKGQTKIVKIGKKGNIIL